MDILLSATLSFKLPAKDSHPISGLPSPIPADETLSTTVSDQLINKVINKTNNPIAKSNESISATKGFLDTAMQQQAIELLTLQDSFKQ